MFPHIRLSKMVARTFATIIFCRFGEKWKTALKRINSMQMEIVDRLESRFSRARTEHEVRFYHGLSWTYSHVAQSLMAREDAEFLSLGNGDARRGMPSGSQIAQWEDYIRQNFSAWSSYVIQGVYFDRYIEQFILEEERKVHVRQYAHRKPRRVPSGMRRNKVQLMELSGV
ncbi:hypothetical protein OH491_11120 [Termitidicoccus mucosus]